MIKVDDFLYFCFALYFPSVARSQISEIPPMTYVLSARFNALAVPSHLSVTNATTSSSCF